MKSKLVKNSMDYIEQHLEESMTLDILSSLSHYSKYHYHRLFLSEMNMSVTRYIRLRRVTRASQTLFSSSLSITEIALISGFSNIDTFIRSFKDVFGMTPSEFRRCEEKSDEVEEKKLMKEYFSNIKSMNKEEKESCIGALDSILEISKKAHKKGLLSLEDEYDSKYLNKAIELLVDGKTPLELRSILENYIYSSKYSSKEILERVVYLEGVLMIQLGKYPWEIRTSLGSYFGEEMIDVLKAHYESEINYDVLKNKYLDQQVIILDNKDLLKELKSFNNRQLQRVIRECHKLSLLIASYGVDKKMKEQILDNMSIRGQYDYLELDNLLNEILTPHVVDASNEVLKIIRKLRLENDI